MTKEEMGEILDVGIQEAKEKFWHRQSALNSTKEKIIGINVVSEIEAKQCIGHHYPNFCTCYVYDLQQEITHLRADLMLAIKYLKEAKAKHAPNTTNSFVDDLINKYSAEVEVWVDECE